MSTEPLPISSQQLDDWLMSLPLSQRKEKQDRLIRLTGKSKRTIDNWRAGRPIPERHFAAIREVMAGRDKVTMELEPELAEYLGKKAAQHGYTTIPEYLEAITKLILSVAFLSLLGYQLTHPDERVRRFARRREDCGAVVMAEE